MAKGTKETKIEIPFKVIEMNHFSEAAAAKLNKRLNEITATLFATS